MQEKEHIGRIFLSRIGVTTILEWDQSGQNALAIIPTGKVWISKEFIDKNINIKLTEKLQKEELKAYLQHSPNTIKDKSEKEENTEELQKQNALDIEENKRYQLLSLRSDYRKNINSLLEDYIRIKNLQDNNPNFTELQKNNLNNILEELIKNKTHLKISYNGNIEHIKSTTIRQILKCINRLERIYSKKRYQQTKDIYQQPYTRTAIYTI